MSVDRNSAHPPPEGPATLIAAALALGADRDAQSTAWGMWQWCRSDHEHLGALVRKRADGDLAARLEAVERAPRDTAAYRALLDALGALLSRDAEGAAELGAAARALTGSARISMHIGAESAGPREEDRLDVGRLLAGLDPAAPRPTAAPARATVVIPFRAREGDGRDRNLAACLASLDDQSLPREQYRVVVVEGDDAPRWAETFAGAADDWVFARKPGGFNKAWTVNCGVVHAGGTDELVCILDGDILADRGFLARGVARFDDETLQGHWPYRDVLFADAASSVHAVHRRCAERAPDVARTALRGTVLHRPPGGCIWVRRSLFDRMAGMDERFEGWGGEDNDFAWRAELYGGLERFDDHLLHLHHARSAPPTADEAPSMDAFPWCTWPTGSRIGDLDKHRAG